MRLIHLDTFRKKWLGIAKTYEACALSALRRGAGEVAEEYGEDAIRCTETAASLEAQIQDRLTEGVQHG